MVRWNKVISFIIALLLPFVLLPFSDSNYPSSNIDFIHVPQKPSISQQREILDIYNKMPLLFIENRGQVDKKVRYYTKMRGQTIYLTDEKLVFELVRPVANNSITSKYDYSFEAEKLPPKIERLVYSLNFVNASTNTMKISGLKQNQARFNYFISNDPEKWYTNIPSYDEVVCENIYPNIDLRLYNKDNSLAYDFIVNPGGRVEAIKLAYNGIDELFIENTKLIAQTKLGNIEHANLNIYQELSGENLSVSGGFSIIDGNTYGFAVALYDSNKSLIIDPSLVYSTYFGGHTEHPWPGPGGYLPGQDFARDIAIDSSGCAYITGFTESIDLATANAYQVTRAGPSDAFITKISADGKNIIYCTYLGGSISNINYTDRSNDEGWGIAIDSLGSAYITGFTGCTDFPIRNAVQSTFAGGYCDIFVTKLSPEGNKLIYSTYLGGNDLDDGHGIAIDANGYSYITGATRSSNFPTFNAFQSTANHWDAVVFKLSPEGNQLVYSTYLGGNRSSDSGMALSVDTSGCVYVTGFTDSSNFPTLNGFQTLYGGGGDAFVTKLSANGNSLLYSSYLGGNTSDSGYGISVDSAGCIYITGYTDSNNFPTLNAFQSTFGGGSYDAFVTKINTALSGASSLIYSTYLGGSSWDFARDIAIDSSGCAYVVGETGSSNFPIRNPLQRSIGGGNDVFITKISSSGNSLVYSTFLGGSNADCGYGIAVDSFGCAYITGFTDSANFPAINGSQNAFGDFRDVFIAKLGASAESPPVITTNDATNIGINSASINGNLILLGSSLTCNILVQYGTSPGVYPNETTALLKTSTGTFIHNLTNLISGIKYYFRTKAVGDGTSYGEEKNFTTLKAPIVTTNNATQIGFTFATLNMSYTIGDYSPVDVRFAYKKSADTSWNYTSWVSKAADGNHAELLNGLDSNTQYDFRAELKYNPEIQGNTLQFTTLRIDTATVNTATGTGIAMFTTSNGSISNLTSSLTTPCGSLAGFSSPHGFFSFNIINIPVGSTVTITITLPLAMPANTQYWKCINGQWVDITSLLGNNDGDIVLTLTITDGGLGDADGIANGTIVDPGGPATPVAPAQKRSLLTESSSAPQAPAHSIASPANIIVTSLNAQPQQAKVNQAVTIYANIANRGDEAGNYTATLKINGQVEEIKTGKVIGHVAVPLQFIISRDKPGTYTVDINGQQSIFTIAGDSSSSDNSKTIPLIGFFLCAIGVVLVSVLLVLRRCF